MPRIYTQASICRSILSVVAIFGLVPSVSTANDGVVGIVSGGLVAEKTDAVRIAKEELYISTDRIDVRYIFENITDDDVSLTLAFPLPDTFADEISDRQETLPEGAPFVDFTTLANGKSVATKEIIEIIDLDNKPITDLFIAEGFPLSPADRAYGPPFYDPTDTSIVSMKERMRDLGLLGNFESRKWKTRISYVWDYTFKAKSSTAVFHSYKPIVGAFIFTPTTRQYGNNESFENWFRRRFCAGPNIWAGMRRIEHPTSIVREVGYVLGPAATWAGPIGDFRLTIDKGHAENVMSFCWDRPLKKLDATTFSFKAKNFVPNRNILIAILEAPNGADQPER